MKDEAFSEFLAGVQRTKRANELVTKRPPFLYTLDQLAQVVNMNEEHLVRNHIHKIRPGNSEKKSESKMIARNIGHIGQDDWRVTEHEFARWLVKKGFKPISFWDII